MRAQILALLRDPGTALIFILVCLLLTVSIDIVINSSPF